MKKSFITLLFMCVSTLLLGQVNELGFFVGGTNFIGDVGRTNYIYPNKVAGGLIYKWNWNPRLAVRGTMTHMPISGNDADADNSARQIRGEKFENTINEIALGIEFNFYEYDLTSKYNTWTPYILAEVAAFNYLRVKSKTGTSPNTYSYTDETSYAIPFGVGIKSKFSDNFAVAFETRFRYTFVDNIDYSTSNFAALNYEGTDNDWYVFTGFSLVYTFGRPACYTTGF